MTPLDALSRATDKYLPDTVLDDLRALGFVIVPVEATEEMIERMAKGMGFFNQKRAAELARAAYAALTASPASETDTNDEGSK